MKKFNSDFIRYFSFIGSIGFMIIINIGFFVLIYKLIEKYFFSSTLLFIFLLLFGVVSAFYNVYKMIMGK